SRRHLYFPDGLAGRTKTNSGHRLFPRREGYDHHYAGGLQKNLLNAGVAAHWDECWREVVPLEKGYLCLVLHAHLPYVRHPEHEHFLEEKWLFEAITETYIPLLKVFEQLAEAGVHYRLTMSLTPPLLSMLNDHLLQDRYLNHLEKLIELAAREIERTRWLPDFNRMAHYYHDMFTFSRWYFAEKCQKNLIAPFRRLQDEGYLELITCGATHGYLPLM